MKRSPKQKTRSPNRRDPAATIIDLDKQYPAIDDEKIRRLEKLGRRTLTDDLKRRLATVIGRYCDAYDRQKLPPRRETKKSLDQFKNSIITLIDFCSGNSHDMPGVNAVRIRVAIVLSRMEQEINIEQLFHDLALLGRAAEMAQESLEQESSDDSGSPNKDLATDNLYRGLDKIFEKVEGAKNDRAKITFFKAAFELIPEAKCPAQEKNDSILRRINRIRRADEKYFASSSALTEYEAHLKKISHRK